MFLDLNEVTKSFGEVTALSDIGLALREGELICFLGPSGCGKTTLLRLVAGLECPGAGRILLNGEDLAARSARDRNFGIVFQSYSLFPNMMCQTQLSAGSRLPIVLPAEHLWVYGA